MTADALTAVDDALPQAVPGGVGSRSGCGVRTPADTTTTRCGSSAPLGHLESFGARVVRRPPAERRHERFAGSDVERLHELAAVVDDPTIGIALALRGGYGATRLLSSIDFTAMAASVAAGKRFVGHSDFTAIALALLARTGAISFAGPMASYDFGAETVDAFTAHHFLQAMRTSSVDIDFATSPVLPDRVERGVLWGGNLTMLVSLIGTPWMPRIDDGILFVEDINEQPYRIERMLLQLHQAGILSRQRLVLLRRLLGLSRGGVRQRLRLRCRDRARPHGHEDAARDGPAVRPLPAEADPGGRCCGGRRHRGRTLPAAAALDAGGMTPS